MVKKKNKKKKGDLIAHQSSIDSATTSSYSDDDTYDYIVFEADTSTTASEGPGPCVVHVPSRHVRFSDEIVTHVIDTEDRKGYWIEDMFRFQQRRASVRDAISFIFDEGHRRKMRLIVNMSGRMRTAIVPYSGMYGELRSLSSELTTTINISRDFFMPWWRS